MAIGRLELGEVEATGYAHPVTQERVEMTFRHATAGDLSRSFALAGLTIKDTSIVALDGSEMSAFEIHARSEEDAEIELAKLCILSSSIPVDEMYQPALVFVGEYLRAQAKASEDEKKPSVPLASGHTPES